MPASFPDKLKGYLKTIISVFQVAFVHYNFNTHLR